MPERRSVLLGLPHLLGVASLLSAALTRSVAANGAFYFALIIAGLITTTGAARSVSHVHLGARPWWLLGLGWVCLVISTLGFIAAGLADADQQSADQGWLFGGILARFAFIVVFLLALLSLNDRAMNRGTRWRLALDCLTVLGGGWMLIWYYVLGPVVNGARVRLVTLAWELAVLPLAELFLIVGVCTILLRGSTSAGQRPLRLLLVAAVMWFLTDSLSAATALRAGAEVSPVLNAVIQILPMIFMVSAATEQWRLNLRGAQGLARRSLRPVTWTPMWPWSVVSVCC